MKKLVPFFIAITLVFAFVSCKSEAKKADYSSKSKSKTTKTEAAYSLKNANHTINWVAYKTTDKIGVKGQFKKVNITKGGEGNSAKDAINNSEFSIPITSIFTKDTSRDFKIKKFFFGVMDKTELLSGKFMIENDSIGSVDLTMNGITKNLPFTYSLNGKIFNLKATMKISDWNANDALTSLNDACKDLHKGADGVSKTWNDVSLNITSVFK
ncbi:MAG: YceI family protein [Flavobacteriaceae bacterium]